MSVCQSVIDCFGVNLATLGVVFLLRVIRYNVNNVCGKKLPVACIKLHLQCSNV